MGPDLPDVSYVDSNWRGTIIDEISERFVLITKIQELTAHNKIALKKRKECFVLTSTHDIDFDVIGPLG